MTTAETAVDLTKSTEADCVEVDRAAQLWDWWTLVFDGLSQTVWDWWTRSRQAFARGTVLVADHPVAARSLAVGRQLPKAGGRMVLCAPRGVQVLVCSYVDWLRDAESLGMLAHTAEMKDTEAYAKAAKVRESKDLYRRRAVNGLIVSLLAIYAFALWLPQAFAGVLAMLVFVGLVALAPRRHLNEMLTGLGVAGAAGAAIWFWVGPWLASYVPRAELPVWAWWTLGGVAVLVCGWAGRREDRPLVKMPVSKYKPPPITAPMLIAALCALGNTKMSAKTQEDPKTEISLVIDGVRNGPGWNFHFLLPPGVTASWVMEKREELAGAMRFPLGCVWPSVGKQNPSYLVLDITDEALKDAEQEPWPVLTMGQGDLSKPQPIGTNQKGEWVYAQLAYANVIIGAVPRVGKTFFLRSLLMLAALDPHARVYAIDGKGTGDLSPCMQFAHGYQRGLRSTRPELIEKVRAMVQELRREMDRRADIIDSLSHEECPESKVTGELIRGRPDLKLGWIVFALDETQMGFGYGDKDNKEHKVIRQELRAGIEELVKLGPALGIIVILATQDVIEETVPNQISRMAVIRFCMKVEDDKSNNRILGAGAYGRGLRATMFTQDDLGIGYIKAEGGVPQIIRTVWGLDKPACESISARGRQLRIAAGTLTGDAAGEEPERIEPIDLRADVLKVLDDQGRSAMHLGELAECLTEMFPDRHPTRDAAAMGSALRAVGIAVDDQVKVQGRNTAGVRRTAVER